ncbi:MAG: hypothetical protein V3T31_13675 [candidate division Zixibacteria bacterium]
MKWLNSSDIRLMLIGFIVAFVTGAASGQTEDSNAEPAGITAAGPRLGNIVVVEVTIPNRDALNELARAEYDISNVQGNVVTIHATQEEFEKLKQTGYPLRKIERQPQGFDIMA